MNMKPPCLTCEVHVLQKNKNKPRCINCPDRQDFVLIIQEQEPRHRALKPDALGYVEFNPESERNFVLKIDERERVHQAFRTRVLGYVEFDPKKGSKIESFSELLKSQKNKGKSKMEKEFKKQEDKFKNKSRTCPKCSKTWKNKDIPLYFSKSGRSQDGYMRICTKCFKKALKEGIERSERNIIKNDNILIINFSDYQDLLEALKEEARENIRTVEGQALYFIKQKMKTTAKWSEKN